MSKRIYQHPPETMTGKRYWRSLGQLQDTPEFRGWLEREFPRGAAEFSGDEVSRRNFLQLMGASVALAGLSLSACRRPLKTLVPFTKGVEWSIPGKALFFSSAMPSRKGGIPLVVTTFDGRPTKIEGNPGHPCSRGATDVWAQASILDLYNPYRAKTFVKSGGVSSRDEFFSELDERLKASKDGSGLSFLVDASISPTRERLRGLIQEKYPKAKWAIYEPGLCPLESEAVKVCFGDNLSVRPDLSNADVIVSVDRDFLGVDGDLPMIREFATRRTVVKSSDAASKMNRLYVVENRYTLTGGMSDHRLRLAASRCGAFLKALAAEVAVLLKDEALSKVASELKADDASISREWVQECAVDLAQRKSKAVVLVGQSQPAAVQALGYALNVSLNAMGSTLKVFKTSTAPGMSITDLAADLRKGATQSLIILGGNPVYDAPADAMWLESQRAAKFVAHLTLEPNETSDCSTWLVPSAHYLEDWGDARASDGSYMVIQPMILPLYGGVSEVELLAKVAGVNAPPLEVVQQTFSSSVDPSADITSGWYKTLKDGFLGGSAASHQTAPFRMSSAAEMIRSYSHQVLLAGQFEVALITDSKVDDGRYSSNGWLQELPDPITKLTWDNAALISPKTASYLGVNTGDFISIKVGDRSVDIPSVVSPGHADDSVSLPLGYGRSVCSSVGRNVGVNVYPILLSGGVRFRVGASIAKGSKRNELAITQEHGALEGRGADITRQATVAEWSDNSEERNPEYFRKMGIDAHSPENFSLYSHPPLDDVHGWGMTVDLNTCTGCSACMVACQAENNIPIVGKEQVINGREMHWIRTDRYFASEGWNESDPEMVSQPMMCQQCENAPCETVCPVNATVHSEDGLNVMAYNRCIGTRYCANNCPFKVRRFNFFDYNQRSLSSLYQWNLLTKKGTPQSIQLQKNPNVTVRMRGVMEKCTFCVQRIQEAKIAAKVHAKDTVDKAAPRVPADAFTTACAQVCPTGSITFGDIKNPESSVAKLRAGQRGYRLLEYLNTENRVWYLSRIRNPNPKMPDALRAGSASRERGHGNTHTGGGVHH